MKYNSKILQFISENPENYEQLLNQKSLRIKKSGPLAILNYNINADFSDPLVQEARGIILDLETMEVACWPFRKFGNLYQDGGESYIDDIDWDTARVQEKIDGSIVKLFYNKYTEQWQWATNSMINARDAYIGNEDPSVNPPSMLEMIVSCDNCDNIRFDLLNINKTYIFELVCPDNKVVIDYGDRRHLYHTGTRNNITGIETNDDIGIEKPKEYSLKTMKDTLQAVLQLNQANESVSHEGFVVVDGNYNRVKVKSPEYLALHHTLTSDMTYKRIYELLQTDDIGVSELLCMFPDHEDLIREVQQDIDRAIDRMTTIQRTVQSLYDDFKCDKKELYAYLKDCVNVTLAMRFINPDKTVSDSLAFMTNERKYDFIRQHDPKEVHILVGPPASGKLTLAKKFLIDHPDAVVISSDTIRKELYGDKSIQGNSKQVFSLCFNRLDEAISSGKMVIFDAMNNNKKSRAQILEHIPDDYQIVAHVLNTDLDICKDRNNKRERHVPEFVYDRYERIYKEPSKDEGFDIIQ